MQKGQVDRVVYKQHWLILRKLAMEPIINCAWQSYATQVKVTSRQRHYSELQHLGQLNLQCFHIELDITSK